MGNYDPVYVFKVTFLKHVLLVKFNILSVKRLLNYEIGRIKQKNRVVRKPCKKPFSSSLLNAELYIARI